jgi:arsenite methyltransferase
MLKAWFRPRYGFDAPAVVRGLGLGSILLFLCQSLAKIDATSVWLAPFLPTMWLTSIATGGMTLWMIASSLWLKALTANKLLRTRQWRGNERVLDVGCGSGLLSVMTAERVPRGSIIAIDLWHAADLSDNNPDTICANARAKKVDDRIEVKTGDARALPFKDAYFDVVASMTVIHNIPHRIERETAIKEMWRVLEPGGQILLFDITYTRSYTKIH